MDVDNNDVDQLSSDLALSTAQQNQQHHPSCGNIVNTQKTRDNGNNDNINNHAEALIGELLSITNDDDNNEFDYAEDERLLAARSSSSRQLEICTELLELLELPQRAREAERSAMETWREVTTEEGSCNEDHEESSSSARARSGSDGQAASSDSFIRTNIPDYNHVYKNNARGTNDNQFGVCDNQSGIDDANSQQRSSSLPLREALGPLPSSITSDLAATLTRLIAHRVEIERLLPGTQDLAANLEAMGMSITSLVGGSSDRDNNNHGGRRKSSSSSSSVAKAAMTISPLAMKASQLYVELLGTKGAWGAGMIDVGGISAVSAMVRRWCTECRGREAVLLGNNNKKKKKVPTKGKGNKGKPAAKRSKIDGSGLPQPSRKSVRISEVVSVMNAGDEDDDDSVMSDDDLRPEFRVEEPDNDSDNAQLTEYDMITGGLRLAKALGRAPLQADYKNWSSEAREFFLEGASAALGIASALLAGCKGKDEVSAAICGEAVLSLEYALRTTVLPPVLDSMGTGSSPNDGLMAAPLRRPGRSRRRNSLAAKKEDTAAEKRLQESGIYLLRGLLFIFNLKMELPNGQAGKLAAFATVSSLLINVITSIAEDIELNSRSMRWFSKSPREQMMADDNSGITPKRGGRKSIGFSKTPAANKRRDSVGPTPTTAMLAPPSLKKSITPKQRARNSALTPSAFGDRPTLHPILSLILGMLHRLFTSKGLERAETRSRTCSFGIACLAQLPTLERSNLLKFVGDMCESKISSHRLLGVELIGEILCQGWFWKDHENLSNTMEILINSSFGEKASDGDDGDVEVSSATADPPPSAPRTPSATLLTALQGRLTDKSPTVRTRAALSLSEVARKASLAQEEGRNLDGTVIASTPTNLTEANIPSRALTVALCKIGTSLVDALRHRASTDDRASVRKSAVMAWFQMLHLAHRENKEDFEVSGLDISALCQLCNDSSVATRKAAAHALTELVKANYDNSSDEYTPQASSLEIAWAYTVLPLVSDAEASCVMKAVEFFSVLVIEPIVELGGYPERHDDDDDERTNTRYLVAWRILSKLSDGSKEAGGSRNASGSLIIALRKLFINGKDNSKSLAKNLFRAVYRVGGTSLGLDRQEKSHSMNDSSAPMLEDELEINLFDPNTTAMRTGSWCLLASLCSCLTTDDSNTTKMSSSTANVSLSQAVRASRIDSSFLTLSLQKLRALMNSPDVPPDKKANLAATSRDCLRVISKMGCFVPFDDAEACFAELQNDLESFTVSIVLIPSAVHASIALTKRICDGDKNEDSRKKEVFGKVRDWVNGLLRRCETATESCLSSLAQRGSFLEQDEKLLSHVLYMVGELSMVGFTSQEESSRLIGNAVEKSRDDVAYPTGSEPVRGLLIRPSTRLVHLVKLLLPNTLPMLSSTVAEDEQLTPTPSALRAHAFIALGKLCLRDESLAKESLNILARELHRDSHSDPAVSSNCLMVMGDLCVRYTNLVDKYLPFMAACLQAGEGRASAVVDNSGSRLSLSFQNRKIYNGYSLVKKNAILLLSSLLLQDYIKWRGLFVHRFLASVADEDDEVSCLASAALRGPLLEKQPNLLCNHLVGAVFVFNSCKAHPIYAAEASGGGNGLTIDFEGASLAGNKGYHRRREVYKMMLSNMSDEQKLEVTARLVKEILGGALQSSGDLSAVCNMPAVGIRHATRLPSVRIEAATNVLTDTLTILTSPEIKVGRKGTEDVEDDLVSANGSRPDQQRNVHKIRLLSKISRKHLMEIVIPILCNLKTVLEGSHSPLLKQLMQYLGKIFRSYKSEVQEHLANNPILLQELEYDTRQYEKNQKQNARDSILQADVVTDEAAA